MQDLPIERLQLLFCSTDIALSVAEGIACSTTLSDDGPSGDIIRHGEVIDR